MARNVKHLDETLRLGSDYLEYHVNMYASTFVWLSEHREEKSVEKNAVLESHLVNARILIDFLHKTDSHYANDVLAIDFFHDMTNAFTAPNDAVLTGWARNIGKRAVHITTEPMPDLKSEQEWDIAEIAEHLVPLMRQFMEDVPETRLYDDREKYLEHLNKVLPQSS